MSPAPRVGLRGVYTEDVRFTILEVFPAYD